MGNRLVKDFKTLGIFTMLGGFICVALGVVHIYIQAEADRLIQGVAYMHVDDLLYLMVGFCMFLMGLVFETVKIGENHDKRSFD